MFPRSEVKHSFSTLLCLSIVIVLNSTSQPDSDSCDLRCKRFYPRPLQTHTHTDPHTDRHTYGHTDRHTDRHTGTYILLPPSYEIWPPIVLRFKKTETLYSICLLCNDKQADTNFCEIC